MLYLSHYLLKISFLFAIAITLFLFPITPISNFKICAFIRGHLTHICLASHIRFPEQHGRHEPRGTSARLSTGELPTHKKQQREHTFSRGCGLQWLFCGLLCIGMAI